MYKKILISHKIKYVVMDELLLPHLINYEKKEINLFVSMNSILKSFYSYKPDEVSLSLSHAPSNALSSEIINILAHYRHYFWSRYGIATNLIVYYSFDMCEYCCNIDRTYKEPYYDKRNGNTLIKE